MNTGGLMICTRYVISSNKEVLCARKNDVLMLNSIKKSEKARKNSEF